MISNSNVSLPYPVLGLEGDFKDGGFVVKPTVQIVNNELYIFEDEVEISNKYINDLFQNGYVTTAYKIVCPSTLYSNSTVNEKQIIIPLDLLANHIVIEVFLVANMSILDYSDGTFNEDYKLGESRGHFQLVKGNIVGFAGSIKIPLKKSWVKGATSMFKFTRGEDVFMSFDVLEGDQIVITYPFVESQEADITRHMSKSNKMTFLNLFIIPALNSAFVELCRQEEIGTIDDFVENHEWALIITETYIDWRNDDTYRSAQNYLMQILTKQGKTCKIPILEAFDELKG
jgi:hypothetical protein